MVFPKIGNMAPAFTLKNQAGRNISLKDFKGKQHVVLYFYPKAMTPGCTTQACGIRDMASEFSRLNTVILGVSPDPQSRLQKFIDKYELNFNLLSDEDHSLAERYGVWGPKQFMGKEFMGILRTTFLIDKNGRIQHIIDKVKTKTHHEDVVEYISKNL